MEYKGFNVVGDGTFGHTIIKNIGKGPLPKRLRGTFTSPKMAMIEIDRNEKGSENGKRKSTG